MSEEPTHADLKAEIAGLRAMTVTKFEGLELRLSEVEREQRDFGETQRELVKVATTGKAGLRTLLLIGGLVTAALSALAAAWSVFSGN